VHRTIYKIESKRWTNSRTYKPGQAANKTCSDVYSRVVMMHGAAPLEEQPGWFRRTPVTQHAVLPKFSAAPDWEQPVPPHCSVSSSSGVWGRRSAGPPGQRQRWRQNRRSTGYAKRFNQAARQSKGYEGSQASILCTSAIPRKRERDKRSLRRRGGKKSRTHRRPRTTTTQRKATNKHTHGWLIVNARTTRTTT